MFFSSLLLKNTRSISIGLGVVELSFSCTKKVSGANNCGPPRILIAVQQLQPAAVSHGRPATRSGASSGQSQNSERLGQWKALVSRIWTRENGCRVMWQFDLYRRMPFSCR
jgi:hypothetical protein